jgi:hypothetical protein
MVIGARDPARAEAIMQVLFCEPSLGKVGTGRVGLRKVFPYHDTDLSASFALALSGVAKK